MVVYGVMQWEVGGTQSTIVYECIAVDCGGAAEDNGMRSGNEDSMAAAERDNSNTVPEELEVTNVYAAELDGTPLRELDEPRRLDGTERCPCLLGGAGIRYVVVLRVFKWTRLLILSKGERRKV
jgi:hypothetical protein